MEFDEAKLAPTYRLMWGIPGRSNALNIASRLGMDADIIQAARARMGSAQVGSLGPCTVAAVEGALQGRAPGLQQMFHFWPWTCGAR